MSRKFTGDLISLAQAITEFELTLPGWWWEVGSCSIAANAYCGPDILGPDAGLINHNEKAFGGLHHQGPTCADALQGVMKDAMNAKAANNLDIKTTTPESTPAEVVHPSVFIREEMDTRGWDQWELARRMGGDVQINYISLDLYFGIGPTEPGIRLGDGEDFARAFGTPAEFWRNLEKAWLIRQV